MKLISFVSCCCVRIQSSLATDADYPISLMDFFCSCQLFAVIFLQCLEKIRMWLAVIDMCSCLYNILIRLHPSCFTLMSFSYSCLLRFCHEICIQLINASLWKWNKTFLPRPSPEKHHWTEWKPANEYKTFPLNGN